MTTPLNINMYLFLLRKMRCFMYLYQKQRVQYVTHTMNSESVVLSVHWMTQTGSNKSNLTNLSSIRDRLSIQSQEFWPLQLQRVDSLTLGHLSELFYLLPLLYGFFLGILSSHWRICLFESLNEFLKLTLYFFICHPFNPIS